MNPRALIIAAAFAAACGADPARAEVIAITAQLPAKFQEASLLRRLAIRPFEGPMGAQVASAVEAELAVANPGEPPYFTIIAASDGRKRIGDEGVLSGKVTVSASETPFQDQQNVCVESAGFMKCKRRQLVTQNCVRRVISMSVDARVARGSDRRVVYAATKPFQDQATWCDGQTPQSSTDEIVMAMARAAAAAIKKDIAPYRETYQVRLEESTAGLSKPAAKAFKASVKISTRDFPAACAAWQQLNASGETNAALLFDLGVCAEAGKDFVKAASLYGSAQQSAPDNKNIAESNNRTRILVAAQQTTVAQKSGREAVENAERQGIAAEEKAALVRQRAADRLVQREKAAAAAARTRERQVVATKYGADAADAIIAKTVKKGMTASQVRAALGSPQRIQRIGAGEEQWFYPGRRVVFLGGKVTFVG